MSLEEITTFLGIASASFPLCYYALQWLKDRRPRASHRPAVPKAPLVPETPGGEPEGTPDTPPEATAPVLPNSLVELSRLPSRGSHSASTATT
jgi:hypothetical protein